MNRGFGSLLAIILVAIIALGAGGIVYYQKAEKRESQIRMKAEPNTETTPKLTNERRDGTINLSAESALVNSAAKESLEKRQSSGPVSVNVASVPMPVSQKSSVPPMTSLVSDPVVTQKPAANPLDDQFKSLEREIMVLFGAGNKISPDHYQRLTSGLNNLESQGYSGMKIGGLRNMLVTLDPSSEPPTKQSYIAPASCSSNPNPVFTNHITDINAIQYIGPPPTMGAGPSLKTHSYIGTEHARVPIYAPAAMTLANGSHYVGGPYTMEFQVSCEVRVRFGHVTEPIEAIKKLLPSEPQPDSRTQELSPVKFIAGELVGYTTGTDMAGNWDFGVYNSATRNRYVDDPTWNNSSVYTTAVCPFNYFAPNLKSFYFSKFNPSALGGNPPHGEPFCGT